MTEQKNRPLAEAKGRSVLLHAPNYIVTHFELGTLSLTWHS
jgi:hypothetical protein